MANFNPPFANGADKKYPTSDQRVNGFDCGPADRELFDGLFHRIESEIGSVITEAGITHTDDRMTLLLEAIQALIEAATGGGDPSTYLLMAQARARLPIYPEIQNTDGKIAVSSPSTGVVRVPAGVTFQHRGIFPVTTAQTDFNTLASKTYHLRWSPTGGFVLKDLSDAAYNPGVVAEDDPKFDSGFDDMLVSRVITNSSNIATITNLVNRHVLRYTWSRSVLLYPPGGLGNPSVDAAANEVISTSFSRTPFFMLGGFSESAISGPSSYDGSESNFKASPVNRYQSTIFTFSFNAPLQQGARPEYTASLMAVG